MASDYNSIRHKRDYLSHQNRVTGVIFCPSAEWVLSVARDKFFVYHCTESGRRLGGHQSSGWCTALQYDYKSKHVFVGDYSGQITMLKLEESGPQVITVLKVIYFCSYFIIFVIVIMIMIIRIRGIMTIKIIIVIYYFY